MNLSITTRLGIVAAVIVCASALIVHAQTRAVTPATPDALVADLYKVQKQKRGPFFQTRSRVLVDKYFVKSLGDLIWKDARTSKGEVGVIDGDPLYDAQDMEIKNFAISKPAYEAGKAKVAATFENFGDKKKVVFVLVKGPAGWRIDDIDYGEGRTLRSEFKEAREEERRNDRDEKGRDETFEGSYEVGDTMATVRPTKMAFQVKWAASGAVQLFFNDAGGEKSGKKVFVADNKNGGKDRFVFDDGRCQAGVFMLPSGKQVDVQRID